MVDCEEYVVDLIIEIVKQCILEMEGWMDRWIEYRLQSQELVLNWIWWQ